MAVVSLCSTKYVLLVSDSLGTDSGAKIPGSMTPAPTLAEAPELVPLGTGERSPRPWSPAERVAFRFAFVLTALCIFTLLLDLGSGYLVFDFLTQPVEGALTKVRSFIELERRLMMLGIFVVSRLTGHHPAIVDTIPQYARHLGLLPLCYLLGLMIVTATLTLIWSVADRRPSSYSLLNRWMRAVARWAAALGVISYAMVKVVPTQFGFITPGELIRPFGQLTPFWVLWDFMAASPLYTVFAGVTELAGSVFLCFRRTTLLGALILLAALTNVVVMDIGYHVSRAALWVAIQLQLLVLVILAPYARGLVTLFFLGRSEHMPREPGSQATGRRALVVTSVVLVILLAGFARNGLVQRRSYYGARRDVYGLYNVTSFTRNGSPLTPVVNDRTAWVRVASDGRYGDNWLAIQFADGHIQWFQLTESPAQREWRLQWSPREQAILNYSAQPGGNLQLAGTIGPDHVMMELRPESLAELPLYR